MAQSTVSLRIGTRGSPLALVQARAVRAHLAAARHRTEEEIELVVIRTSGDTIQDRPLAEVGGKGLFTKEIEEALLAGRIDLAVHSSKDMPTLLPEGLELAALLPGGDAPALFRRPQRRGPRRAACARDGRLVVAAPAGAHPAAQARFDHHPL